MGISDNNESKTISQMWHGLLQGQRMIIYTVIGLILIFLLKPIFSVSAGWVGVRFNRITGETSSHKRGTHFKIPFIHSITEFDVRSKMSMYRAEAASKDIQDVIIEIEFVKSLEESKVNDLFVQVGPNYIDEIVNPALKQATKSATAQFAVIDVIAKRDLLKAIIQSNLNKELSQYPMIIIESINLANISFAEDFSKAVEEKMVEAQKVLTEQNKTLQAEEQAKQTVIKAKANAEEQKLMAAAADKDSIALKWIEKWKGDVPQIMTGKGTGLLIQPDISAGE